MNLLSSFTRAGGAAQRVLGLLEGDAVDGRRGDAPQGGGRGAALAYDAFLHYEVPLRRHAIDATRRFTQVHFTYAPFDAPWAGSTAFALVAAPAPGKTTALNLLLRFYDPSRGQITIDGVPLPQLDVRLLCGVVGVVAQDTELFDTTISDNIAYGAAAGVGDGEVREAAEAALAHEFVQAFPRGYDTRVGERGRADFGRSEAKDIDSSRVPERSARAPLLDEATSALDAESESKVQAARRALVARRRRRSCSWPIGSPRSATRTASPCSARPAS